MAGASEIGSGPHTFRVKETLADEKMIIVVLCTHSAVARTSVWTRSTRTSLPEGSGESALRLMCVMLMRTVGAAAAAAAACLYYHSDYIIA